MMVAKTIITCMTLCPGKKDKGILSGLWDRDLEAIQLVRKARVAAIKTS